LAGNDTSKARQSSLRKTHHTKEKKAVTITAARKRRKKRLSTKKLRDDIHESLRALFPQAQSDQILRAVTDTDNDLNSAIDYILCQQEHWQQREERKRKRDKDLIALAPSSTLEEKTEIAPKKGLRGRLRVDRDKNHKGEAISDKIYPRYAAMQQLAELFPEVKPNTVLKILLETNSDLDASMERLMRHVDQREGRAMRMTKRDSSVRDSLRAHSHPDAPPSRQPKPRRKKRLPNMGSPVKPNILDASTSRLAPPSNVSQNGSNEANSTILRSELEAMFPDQNAANIERALRWHNGNVQEAIASLLETGAQKEGRQQRAARRRALGQVEEAKERKRKTWQSEAKQEGRARQAPKEEARSQTTVGRNGRGDLQEHICARKCESECESCGEKESDQVICSPAPAGPNLVGKKQRRKNRGT
jgi:hypothetical protein